MDTSTRKKRDENPPFSGPCLVLALSDIRRLAVTSKQVRQAIWFWVWTGTAFPSGVERSVTKKRGWLKRVTGRFKHPWREAGPLNHLGDKVDPGWLVVNNELSPPLVLMGNTPSRATLVVLGRGELPLRQDANF